MPEMLPVLTPINSPGYSSHNVRSASRSVVASLKPWGDAGRFVVAQGKQWLALGCEQKRLTEGVSNAGGAHGSLRYIARLFLRSPRR